MKKTISLEDKIHTSGVLIELFLLMKITSYFSDQMILLILSNICIFYSIIDKKFPHFLFMCRMNIKQIIEGIIVVIVCIIPNFEKSDKEKEKKQKIE